MVSSEVSAAVAVAVGAVVSPVQFWVAPIQKPQWLVGMEERLSSKWLAEAAIRRRETGVQAMRAKVTAGELVAVGVDAEEEEDVPFGRGRPRRGAEVGLQGRVRVWRRGRLQGEVHDCHGGALADFLLVDSGRLLRNVSLSDRVRPIPADLPGGSDPPQAVNLVLAGLVPVARDVTLEMLDRRSKFAPMVQKEWSCSARSMVEALLGAAKSDCGREGGSEITVVFDKGQHVAARMSGRLFFALSRRAARSRAVKDLSLKLQPPGQKNDLRQVLLATEHAATGKKTIFQHGYQLPDLPLLSEPPPSADEGFSPFENLCGQGDVAWVERPMRSLDDQRKMRESIKKLENEYETMKTILQRNLKLKSKHEENSRVVKDLEELVRGSHDQASCD